MPVPARATIFATFERPGEAAQLRLIQRLAAAPGAADALLELWRGELPIAVRRWVVHALGHVRDRRARRAVVAALRDAAMTVRLHAIHALDRIGDRRLARAALPLLDDPSGGIRMNALDLVAGLRVRGCDAAIRRCLADPEAYVRQRAAHYAARRAAARGGADRRARRARPGRRTVRR